MPPALPPVYPITPDDRGTPALLEWARALLGAGCVFFQHRRKSLPDGARLAELDRLLELAGPFGAAVVVNDRPDLCLLAGAHGVHLGQDDLPLESARQLLGRGAVVGYSTHDAGQALSAADLPLDYLALGPVFPTQTKRNPSPLVPPAVQEAVLAAAKVPVAAIGGVTPGRAPGLWRRGFASVAAIAAFAKDPAGAWRAFAEARAAL